jgi:glutamate synthase domain-containing protein 2
MNYFLLFTLFLIIALFIYDKYFQRRHQLLINYPVIGRFRYFLEALREPLRQYFANEDFYESKDKIDWVYSSSYGNSGYISFAPNQYQQNPKLLIKHSTIPLNEEEVEKDFRVTFGKNRKIPYISKSIISRSAMSDGAISPEGTRAFTKASFDGNFPINTGEGGLTSNFFLTHKVSNQEYMQKIKLSSFDKKLYNIIYRVFNSYIAVRFFRRKLLKKDEIDTYIFDFDNLLFFRPDWSADFSKFPKNVPTDMPDIIFQMSSGLYGVRDENGNFCEDRYKKVLSFCKMTEIKLAQGAKQTGGKLTASKVTPSIAYYRGVKPYENLFSPNRFPYASSFEELFEFISKLQKLSNKPVGIKIVISSKKDFKEFAKEMRKREDNFGCGVPDFITIDGGDGGSATAPLFLMDRVGLSLKDSIYIANSVLVEYGLRENIKIIASSKILTPDDIIVTLSLGADFVSIGRGFMMSAGCIRAKMCSGEGSHSCPVGLATQKRSLRKSYLVYKQAAKIVNYHKALLNGVKTILSIMGKKSINDLDNSDLSFIDKNGFIYSNIDRYLEEKVKF